MRTTILIACVLFASGVAFGETINFDSDPTGRPPEGWTVTQTGSGQAKWTVQGDDTAPSQPNILKQSGEATFPLCVQDAQLIRNGAVEVKFKPLEGKEDQAAGIVWRWRDAENYYITRANALENNVVLYKVEKGRRQPLDIVGRKGGYGVSVPVPSGQWSTLRVEFADSLFTVSLNSKKQFDVEDSTFPDAGKIGLWTKADSVTAFDDFTYEKR